MYYSSFWGFCALSILLILHGIYSLPGGRRIATLQGLKQKKRRLWITLSITVVLCAAVFTAGIVMMLLKVEAPAIHGMGLIVLLLAFALNALLRRCAAEAEENEKE